MKLGFVVDDTMDKPDGVQQYILTLGRWFADQGVSVHYLAGQSRRTDLNNLHSLGRTLSVRFNGNRLATPLPADSRAIGRLLDREQYDVLHVQLPYSPLLAGRVVRQAGVRTVVYGTFHILPYNRLAKAGTAALGRWLQPTLRRFDRIVAVSDEAAGFARQAFQLPDVDVLPNATDTGRYAAAKPLSRYNDKKPTIVFLGRLVPRKGCRTLIEAAGLLAKQPGRQFRLLVCGKGPLLAELRARTHELGLGETVEFTGFVDESDKPRYIASADIAVFPSSGGESFGIVLIEAMASGRPVVLAGDNPGYRTVMGPRQELLFAARDADELARRLAYYLDDANARRSAVDWQRQYVKQFDVAVVGRQLLADYRQLLKRRRRS